jgi:peptidoglycan/xylan/chitin deacetylase (PgdA/CDA1 family)
MPLIDIFKRTAAVLMLPLSLVPIYLALPRLKAEFGTPSTETARAPLAPVPVSFSPQEVRAFKPLPITRNAIPVLAYHGVNGNNDVYSVSRRTFASHMQMLHDAGFRTISIQQYIRFLDGDRAGLPQRPILITFDDGRLDSYRGADKVLARFDFRATMFVIAQHADEGSSFYLTWDNLREMAKSGHWDIQEHAGNGHYNVRWGKGAKDTGPFYAYRRMTGNGLESFDAYGKRVVKDVEWGMARLKKEIPGFAPYAFAVPYGNYGQLKSNDPRIKTFFGGYLQKRFRAVFVVQPSGYTTQNTPRGRIGRLEVHTYTTAGRLYTWLTERLPSTAGQLRVPPLWCRPGWTCVPQQAQPRAGSRNNLQPVQVAQRVSLPQSAAPTKQIASTTPTKSPDGGTQPRTKQHEAPLTATGEPSNGAK